MRVMVFAVMLHHVNTPCPGLGLPSPVSQGRAPGRRWRLLLLELCEIGETRLADCENEIRPRKVWA